jgi:ABC-type Zn uptake system ZnuABC Zn-binding protein ZnuA
VEGGPPRVLVSFAPLHSFASNVCGDLAKVDCLLTTTGPHSHGESIREEQVLLARKANLFFINGLGLDESIAKKLKNAAGNKKWNLVEIGEAIDKKQLLEGECHHDHGHKHEGHDHGVDPHLWLCPKRAKAIVEVIAEQMKKVDSANSAKYDERAKAYLAKLDALIAEGQAKLKDKTERSIISFHDSFQYFSQTFGIKIADVIEVDPGVEPSENKMNEIVAKCLKEHVRVIAVEPQFPSRNGAKAILDRLKAKGVEAVFVELDPLETADPAELTPELYIKKITQNLDNLAKVLK